jgi:hypothetical protein
LIQFHHLINAIGVNPKVVSSACDRVLLSCPGNVDGGSETLPYRRVSKRSFFPPPFSRGKDTIMGRQQYGQ